MEMSLWRNALFDQRTDIFSEWVKAEDYIPQVRGDVSLYETECDLVAKARVPGVEARNITILIDEGLLTITACQPESEEEVMSKKIVYREASSNGYIYNVPVVRPVVMDEIVAVVENGVITVTMPKE